MEYKDYLVRGMAAKEQIRFFACTTKDLVEYARGIHHCSPLATAALGRLLSAGAMMGDMLKSPSDKLTIQLIGDGPLRQVMVTGNCLGEVRGYVSGVDAILPPNKDWHLDVGGGIGKGMLTVIRDLGLKQPYVSQLNLHSGEIADDLTYYFAQSEQTPTSVGLGVLFNHDDASVRAAGGFIVQLMPNCESSVIDKLEKNIQECPSVTDILKEGKTPEEMIQIVLKGFDIQFMGTKDLFFRCNCSQERGAEVLMTLGKKDIDEMIQEGKEIDVSCAFCGKSYHYTKDDLVKIRKQMDQQPTSQD